jgi:hypothetical protein
MRLDQLKYETPSNSRLGTHSRKLCFLWCGVPKWSFEDCVPKREFGNEENV